ncbi:MAG: YciI family protein [Planctomycetia bacterium]|nr:YciI family protein [Planctomycetia bacterium]
MIPRPLPQPSSGHELGSCDPAHEAFDENLIKAYMRYNEEMTKAGVLVASEGLNPADPAVQVSVVDGERVLVDGPFTETKELVGGFYVIDVPSKEVAIQWALRCPVGRGHEVLELRRLTDLVDLPPEFQEMIRAEAPLWNSRVWGAK